MTQARYNDGSLETDNRGESITEPAINCLFPSKLAGSGESCSPANSQFGDSMPGIKTHLAPATLARLAEYQRAGILCEATSGAIAECVRGYLKELDRSYTTLPRPVHDPKETSRKATPPPAECVALAADLAAYIAVKIEQHNTPHGKLDNSDAVACGRVLDQMVRLDGIPLADIRPALEFAWRDHWRDGTVYGSVLLSIRDWRTRRNAGAPTKFQKLYEKWLKSNPREHRQQQADTRTPEQRAADFAAFCEAQNVPTRAQQQAALDAAQQQAADASRARQMKAVNNGGEE